MGFVNLVKLCVGAESVDDLVDWIDSQAHRWPDGRSVHVTRMWPKREGEVLDGGSLYWVIKGVIQARQRIVGFEDGHKEDGSACCLLLLDREIVPVRPVTRKAFQGWRYLAAEDAPPDLKGGPLDGLASLPPQMRKDLAALCLI